jgi:hypothetical protein
MSMPPTMRRIVLTVLASAWILILVSPRPRRATARLLAKARRFTAHRIVDREARASSPAEDTWEGEGGATRGADREPDAVAGPVIESPR